LHRIASLKNNENNPSIPREKAGIKIGIEPNQGKKNGRPLS
jgi:hypothetical protein